MECPNYKTTTLNQKILKLQPGFMSLKLGLKNVETTVVEKSTLADNDSALN